MTGYIYVLKMKIHTTLTIIWFKTIPLITIMCELLKLRSLFNITVQIQMLFLKKVIITNVVVLHASCMPLLIFNLQSNVFTEHFCIITIRK